MLGKSGGNTWRYHDGGGYGPANMDSIWKEGQTGSLISCGHDDDVGFDVYLVANAAFGHALGPVVEVNTVRLEMFDIPSKPGGLA